MKTALVIGVGQLGALFAEGLERAGWDVTCAGREWSGAIPATGPIWVCVGEESLRSVVAKIPKAERARVIVCQNEVFPSTLAELGLEAATVLIVWFNRKAGATPKLGPTDIVVGPQSPAVQAAYEALGIPLRGLDEGESLAGALAVKYAFILGINTLGVLNTEGSNLTVGEWISGSAHEAVAAERTMRWAFGLALRACGISDVDGPARAAMWVQLGSALAVHAELPTRGRKSQDRLERAKRLEKSFAAPRAGTRADD